MFFNGSLWWILLFILDYYTQIIYYRLLYSDIKWIDKPTSWLERPQKVCRMILATLFLQVTLCHPAGRKTKLISAPILRENSTIIRRRPSPGPPHDPPIGTMVDETKWQ